MVPPTNQTKLEGEKVQFSCEAKALPGNVTVKWLRENVPIMEVASLETRVTTRRDGSLIVNPVNADDSGLYTCEVSNGIGEPQSASAYLNVECKSHFVRLIRWWHYSVSIAQVRIFFSSSGQSNIHANCTVSSIPIGWGSSVFH